MSCLWSNKVRVAENCGSGVISLFKSGVFELHPTGVASEATNSGAVRPTVFPTDLVCSPEYPRCWYRGDILLPYPTGNQQTSECSVTDWYLVDEVYPELHAGALDIFDVYVTIPSWAEQIPDVTAQDFLYSKLVGLFIVELLNFPDIPEGETFWTKVFSYLAEYSYEAPYHRVSFLHPDLTYDVIPPITPTDFWFYGVAAFRELYVDADAEDVITIHDIRNRSGVGLDGEMSEPLDLYIARAPQAQ